MAETSLLYAIKMFILPPGLFVVLLLGGVILLKVYRRLAYGLIGISIFLLYLLSIPVISVFLAAPLQKGMLFLESKQSQAIVVLGAGRYPNAPEYQGDTVNRMGFMRLRYAAFLYRKTHLPILVSGGKPYQETSSEAHFMQQVLEQDFKVPVRFIENKSNNTRENAIFSAVLLKKAGIHKIILVSDAVHLKRALWSFEKAGLVVVPAGTDFITPSDVRPAILNWLPNMEALKDNTACLYEYLGIIFYHLRA